MVKENSKKLDGEDKKNETMKNRECNKERRVQEAEERIQYMREAEKKY